jgi:pimeloyl-ACP methyl ester carboxylesterase
VQCGVVQRPLNPAEPKGKKIGIHYMVVPSQDRNKLPDALFLLAGGPGQSAINAAGFGKAVLNRLNQRRDLVFVDQRGTGRSAPLQCPELEGNGSGKDGEKNLEESLENGADLALQCLRKLQALPYGDLQYFSTSIAVQDLEAVRLAQGYGPINLVGVSYGTRVGLEYLRQFPQSVRRVVLDGVVPPGMTHLGANVQNSLRSVFQSCAKEAACDASYPHLDETWRKLLVAMPKKVSVTHSRLGTELHLTMTRNGVLQLVQRVLYAPVASSALPYALTQAERGKFGPLIALSGALDLSGPAGIAYGMHFSVWCGEAFARPQGLPPQDDFDALTANLYSKVCEKWPRAQIPPGFFSIAHSAAPVLLLTGGIDPVTPTQLGVTVAKALGKNARHVSLENAGHGLLTQGCVPDVVHRFFNAKSDQEAVLVDAACVRQIPRPLAWQALGGNPNSQAQPAGEKP